MSKLLERVRSLRASQYGRYIPGNKVLAGALAGAVTVALAKTGTVHIPALYVSLGAFALVSYLFPESPVAAAHALARRKPVTVQTTTKVTGVVKVGVGQDQSVQQYLDERDMVAVPRQARPTVTTAEGSRPLTAEEQSAGIIQPVAGVQAPYTGPSQA